LEIACKSIFIPPIPTCVGSAQVKHTNALRKQVICTTEKQLTTTKNTSRCLIWSENPARTKQALKPWRSEEIVLQHGSLTQFEMNPLEGI
jgi:hypothetical protein